MSGNAAATPDPASAASSSAASGASSKPKGNPAFRAIGLPNFRLRLPSRNWTIFLTIVGSWTGALVYDRYQKKKIQKKWCTLVEHVAKEQLDIKTMPRRVTIYLAAPPGDGVRSAREHFVEYVKPVLVAGALDWDVVEGRREGEVRVGAADRIRTYRKKLGEISEAPVEQDVAWAIENSRERTGIEEWKGLKGDIVIGRHTWKEYVRGLHEGWLGPLDQPPDPVPNLEALTLDTPTDTGSNTPPSTNVKLLSSQPEIDRPSGESNMEQQTTSDASSDELASPLENEKEKEEEKLPEKPAKPAVKPPYNTPDTYDSSPLPASIPQQLTPTAPIPFPHILGFLNTPIRMYRFLTRRHLAEDVGRQTAAAVLLWNREFHRKSETPSDGTSSMKNDTAAYQAQEIWEQENVLKHEQKDWHKSTLKKRPDGPEKTWTDPIRMDSRIAERMRLFVLDATNEERARRIGEGAKGIPGRLIDDDEPREAGPYSQK